MYIYIYIYQSFLITDIYIYIYISVIKNDFACGRCSQRGFEASATGGRVWQQWLGLRLQLLGVVCGTSGWVSYVAAVRAGFEASATGGHVWQQWLGLRLQLYGWSCVAAVAGFEASATGGRVWHQWLGFVCGSSAGWV